MRKYGIHSSVPCRDSTLEQFLFYRVSGKMQKAIFFEATAIAKYIYQNNTSAIKGRSQETSCFSIFLDTQQKNYETYNRSARVLFSNKCFLEIPASFYERLGSIIALFYCCKFPRVFWNSLFGSFCVLFWKSISNAFAKQRNSVSKVFFLSEACKYVIWFLCPLIPFHELKNNFGLYGNNKTAFVEDIHWLENWKYEK